ncbi:MAG: NTP transferase domain-containing protein, partial [Ruminococcus sp.]|nr:NTP transferase domain-containing protein [Candidatus Apopatosoma intestinale]
MTLAILAAGMGSRFGGMKQLTPLTDEGEFIIDFTVFDALKAGFDRFVFIIKEENRDLFEKTIGSRLARNGVRYEYAYQTQTLPEGFVCPPERTKPFGTAHAILCAREHLKENFGVVNADDFYGRDAFMKLASKLKTAEDGEKADFVMVGYPLKNTLSENGTVSRGICSVCDGKLCHVEEHKKLMREADGTVTNTFDDGSKAVIPEDTLVSMNCFGFTPSLLEGMDELFREGLSANRDNMQKYEFFLPTAVQRLTDEKKADVTVLATSALWQGV